MRFVTNLNETVLNDTRQYGFWTAYSDIRHDAATASRKDLAMRNLSFNWVIIVLLWSAHVLHWGTTNLPVQAFVSINIIRWVLINQSAAHFVYINLYWHTVYIHQPFIHTLRRKQSICLGGTVYTGKTNKVCGDKDWQWKIGTITAQHWWAHGEEPVSI